MLEGFVLRAVFVLLCLGLGADGYGSGAPCQTQHSLKPSQLYHGSGVKDADPPYKFEVMDSRGRKVKSYKPGVVYKIKLSGVNAHFRGFLIQARLATNNRDIIGHLRAGRFLRESRSWRRQGVQIQQCPPVFDNSITHSNGGKKRSILVKWITSRNIGPIQFFLTVVQDKTVYWPQWTPESGFLTPSKSDKDESTQGSLEIVDRRPQPSRPLTSRPQPSRPEPPRHQTPRPQPPRVPQAPPSWSSKPVPLPSRPVQPFPPPVSAQPSPPAPARPPPQPFPKPAVQPLPLASKPQVPAGVEFKVEQDTVGDRFDFSQPSTSTGVCASNPCVNGGSCTEMTEEEEGYICFCTDKYTGMNCQVENFCHSNPCVYGTCINNEDGFECKCNSEYVGETCNRHCPNYLCNDRGTCIVTEDDEYGCDCNSGWGGDKCEVDLDECQSSPCLNGAMCIDKPGGYDCKCSEGWMGHRCHRPCQNIYKSCYQWEEHDRCRQMRSSTTFFDINCAVTCNQCIYVNSTVNTETPIPPVLEPFSFLIGDWKADFGGSERYPINFPSFTNGYHETMMFQVTQVPMFGTPSINVTSVAVSKDNPNDRIVSNGFLTLDARGSKDRATKVALLTVANDGLAMIEEGSMKDNEIKLRIGSISAYYASERLMPDIGKSERMLVLRPPYLRETVTKYDSQGKRTFYTKFYYKDQSLKVF